MKFYSLTVDSIKTKLLNIVTDVLGCNIINIGSGYNIYIYKFLNKKVFIH